jgi:hypothetical protein
LLVFTHAGNISPEDFAPTLKARTQLLRAEIGKYAGRAVANKIPSVAIDNRDMRTPNGTEWMGELFTLVSERISSAATAPFILAMASSFLPKKKKAVPRIQLDSEQAERIKGRVRGSILSGLTAPLTAIGAVLAGPAGALFGGALGGTVDVVNWVRNRL